jgi:hypothetical protein
MYAILQVLLSFSILTEGIALHGGLLDITNLTQVFHIFLFFISILILQFASFNCEKAGVVKDFFEKSISSPVYTKKYCSFILLFIISGAVLLISANNMILIFFAGVLQNYGLYLLSTINRNSELSTNGSLIYFLLGSFSLCFISWNIYLLANPGDLANLGDLYNPNYFNVKLLLLILILITQLSLMNFILLLNNKYKNLTFTVLCKNIFFSSIAIVTLFFIKDLVVNYIDYSSLFILLVLENYLNIYLSKLMYMCIDLLVNIFVRILFDFYENKYIFILKKLAYLVLIFNIKYSLGLFNPLFNWSEFSLEALKLNLIKEFLWLTDHINNSELQTEIIKNNNSNYYSKQVAQYPGNMLENSLATIDTTNYLTSKLISSFRSINNNYINIKNTLYGCLKNNLELWLNRFYFKSSITTGFSSYFQPYTLPKVVTLQSKAEINLNLIVNSTSLQKLFFTNYMNNGETVSFDKCSSTNTKTNTDELYSRPEVINSNILILFNSKIPVLLTNLIYNTKKLLVTNIVYDTPQKSGWSEIDLCKNKKNFFSTIENWVHYVEVYNKGLDKGLNIEWESFLNILVGKKINNDIKVNMMHFNSNPNENEYIENQSNPNDNHNEVIQQSNNLNAVTILNLQIPCGSLLDFIILNYDNLAPDFFNSLLSLDWSKPVNMNQCLFLYWLNNIEKAKFNLNIDSWVCFNKWRTNGEVVYLRTIPFKYIVYNKREKISIYKEIDRFFFVEDVIERVAELNRQFNNEIGEPNIHWVYGCLSRSNRGGFINSNFERNWILYQFIYDETILSYQNLYNWCKSNIYVDLSTRRPEYNPNLHILQDKNIVFKSMSGEYYKLPLKTPLYVGVSLRGAVPHQSLHNCVNTEKIKFEFKP